ncbi:MAG TPA: histidine phosphatase family protein [Anaeromyxobacteraceae bacterium]|nr:histidine phosphatase family protein [Anaeromyxobacteraceae bacterium]
MSELWLIRHGETEWSRSGQHTGRTDIPLTEQGERQAELLGRRLAGRTFALILTSPLLRARATCHIAAYADVAQDEPDLMEWDYGAYEGRTTAEIREEAPGWTIWTGGVRGGESADQVGARADRVIARCVALDGDVALFAHGHVLRILAARWLGLPAAGGRYLALDAASLSVLGQEHEQRVIRSWNESYDLVEEP